MQRRQKQSLKPPDNTSGPTSPGSPPPSLPLHNHNRRHNGKSPFRRNKRSGSYSLVKCMVQLIIVLMLGITITIIYLATRGPLKSDMNVKNFQGELNDFVHGGGVVVGGGGAAAAEGETGSYSNSKISAGVVNHNSQKQPDPEPEPQTEPKTEPEPEPEPPTNPNNNKPKRTTAEANAYMASQPTDAVDGEKSLKKKLLPLYEKQRTGNEEDLSPVITRWLGATNEEKFGEEIQYWLPKSSTSDEKIKEWKKNVELWMDIERKKDAEQYPILHGAADTTASTSVVGKTNTNDSKTTSKKSDNASDTSGGSLAYPSPAMDGTHPIIQPTFGTHRSNMDAVFALAEGYDLKIYLLFIESLQKTGFDGDLVISVSALSELKPGVEDYLKSYSRKDGEAGLNVVAYTVTWTCYEGDGVTVAKGAKEGVRKCEMVGMYGLDKDEKIAVNDPREARPVATARFELYWAWSLHYGKHNWIMLIDSRDTYFQSDPFALVERDQKDSSDGLLYFFEENSEVAKIKDSKFNSRWLKEAYGENEVQKFFDKPIICSGSTMGEQIAIESYLRGMVAQFDKTKCKLKGCDQGFHNYIYYSGGLKDVQGIRDVVVHEQGKGIINNLGVLRNKPLKEWGLLDESTMRVLNWDKSESAVAHQFDRDGELNSHLKEIRQSMEIDFKADKLANMNVVQEKPDKLPAASAGMVYPSPAGDDLKPIIDPAFGTHRSHVDAIFAMAEGYDLKIYLLFIESLKATGFTGDLVLSVSAISELKDGVEDYLRSHHKEENEDGINIVAYTVTWTCYEGGQVAKGAKEGMRKCEIVGLLGDNSTGDPVKDPREARPVATARYELYWAWSLHYDKHNWIMLIDSRDAYFQSDPFANVYREEDATKSDGLLYFFEENSEVAKIKDSSFNSRWLNNAYGKDAVLPLFDKPIICSGSTMGEQIAIESYLRGMVAQFDKTKCKLKGCDQGFHNYIYYSGGLKDVQGIRDVVVHEQGKGIINNLGVLRNKPLKEWGLLDESTMRVLNWDKSESAVAHQFDRDGELNKHLKGIRQQFLKSYWAEKR